MFIFNGSGIMLVGLRIIPVDPAGVNAPWWVLTVAGIVFACAGLMVVGMGVRQQREERRRAESFSRYNDSQALKDYGWDPAGYAPSRLASVFKPLAAAVLLSLFLSILNYCVFWTEPLPGKLVVLFWEFPTENVLPFKFFVGFLDLILVFVWWTAFMSLIRLFKFRGSFLEFVEFPYALGQAVDLRWRTDGDIPAASHTKFTLRCVEEWYEVTGRHRSVSGHGSTTSRSLVHEELWSATWHGDQCRALLPSEGVDLRFEPPADLPSTKLSAERSIFWELEVHFDLPGADFRETYLVPVYAELASAGGNHR
jgi:hypothetical protein